MKTIIEIDGVVESVNYCSCPIKSDTGIYIETCPFYIDYSDFCDGEAGENIGRCKITNNEFVVPDEWVGSWYHVDNTIKLPECPIKKWTVSN